MRRLAGGVQGLGFAALCLFPVSGVAHLTASNPAEQVRNLAQRYIREENVIFPQRARSRGAPSKTAFEENRPAQRRRWLETEKHLAEVLQTIDEKSLRGTDAWLVYGVLRETVESSVAQSESCGFYHWRVSQISGLSDQLELSARTQPVGSAELRRAALKQWSQLPLYIDIEIKGLRHELAHHYSVPASIVGLVVKHLDVVLSSDESASPYLDPIRRDRDLVFAVQWRAEYRLRIRPALQRYRNFLATYYRLRTRNSISISDLPAGDRCYQALFRSYTSVSLTGNEIFDLGQRTASENQDEMRRLVRQLYGDSDFAGALRRMNEASGAHFSSGEALLDFSRTTLKRAGERAADWFSSLPPGELQVSPYPHRLDHAGAPATYQFVKGERKGIFRVPLSTYEEVTRARAEVTAAHEGVPGHHVERWFTNQNADPRWEVVQSLNLAFVEGWARYAEALAEEMHLYTQPESPVYRRSWLGGGMVVDAGIHSRNWTRDRALAYVMESGYFQRDEAETIIDRIIARPARLTAYDYGAFQFQDLRTKSHRALGNRFDIREFHRLILQHGPLPFWMLRLLVLPANNKN